MYDESRAAPVCGEDAIGLAARHTANREGRRRAGSFGLSSISLDTWNTCPGNRPFRHRPKTDSRDAPVGGVESTMPVGDAARY